MGRGRSDNALVDHGRARLVLRHRLPTRIWHWINAAWFSKSNLAGPVQARKTTATGPTVRSLPIGDHSCSFRSSISCRRRLNAHKEHPDVGVGEVQLAVPISSGFRRCGKFEFHSKQNSGAEPPSMEHPMTPCRKPHNFEQCGMQSKARR